MHEPQFSDTIEFESNLVRIGAFRCDRLYPGFQDTGPANNDCFVFPRRAVAIEHEHEPTFAANPNVITFYNRGQRYLRHGVSDDGDRCDWFGIDRQIARDAVRAVRGGDPEQPFNWTRSLCDSKTYLHQRRIFELARRGGSNALQIEEESIALLERVIPRANASRTEYNRGTVHEVELLLSARFEQPLKLSEIAAHVNMSVFHLCRTFRRVTGWSIHAYLKQLRVRHGLERVCSGNTSLNVIATDLAFAHHSHFTSAFHHSFGAAPSIVRAQITACEPRC
jgi:AraC family transcriptional regulator